MAASLSVTITRESLLIWGMRFPTNEKKPSCTSVFARLLLTTQMACFYTVPPESTQTEEQKGQTARRSWETGGQTGLACVNGYYDGTKCVCKKNSYGSLCEFILNQIFQDEVTAKVEITVRVIGNFTEELNNTESLAYKTFVVRFEKQMNHFYQDVHNKIGVRVISMRRGSIVVDHVLLLKVNFNRYTEEYEEALKALNGTLNYANCTNQGDEENLWFVEGSAEIRRTEINIPAVRSQTSSGTQETDARYLSVSLVCMVGWLPDWLCCSSFL
ncbi:mucin-3A-like [Discoglossus pictus]